MEPPIRYVVCGALLAFALPAAAADAAARYPAKPVRIVAPFPSGGTADLLARMLADHLSHKWTQQDIVDNRAGAGGLIGTDIVAKARSSTRSGATCRT